LTIEDRQKRDHFLPRERGEGAVLDDPKREKKKASGSKYERGKEKGRRTDICNTSSKKKKKKGNSSRQRGKENRVNSHMTDQMKKGG